MKQQKPFDVMSHLATTSLIVDSPRLSPGTMEQVGIRCGELLRMLEVRNGFYAFESALHVFPAGRYDGVMDVEQWNDRDLWRSEYSDLAEDSFFFAEDVFGGQFCVKEGRIWSFEPETGQLELLAVDLSSWWDRVVKDYGMLTGYPLAHAWQERYGGLQPGKRLLPKTPFVLGGAFDVDNLYAGDAVEGMRFRGHLATKIRHLPDGTEVKLKVTE